ncbi:hypothetical protein NCLIV_023500 [Neospora caninum Liverpool]|nr:hypothetical protein NCLIV_023500 [Neospora caninum Liverpool]CBZ52562.1 hypothetical protein NCLIV_023500 [Neospora caninum Liverpool]|eukprot:XP_003882594.1 hypothetical protein NCLIV_023500 [Neospora caninum Liverpool]
MGKASGHGSSSVRPIRECISSEAAKASVLPVAKESSPPESCSASCLNDEDSCSVSSAESEVDIDVIFQDATRLGWTGPQLDCRGSSRGSLGSICLPTAPHFSAPKLWVGLGSGKTAAAAAGLGGLAAAGKELDYCHTEFDVSVDSLFDQRQSLMEAAADLEASMEADPLLVCRIKQLGVAKAISQLYPDAQWPGEVPLITCLLSRAYARAGYEEQARWHVECAAALLNALGIDDAQIACSVILQNSSASASDNTSAAPRGVLASGLPEEEPSNATATESIGPSDSLADTSMLCPPRTGGDELSDDLLLMEFFFSLAEALFASRSFTKAIGGFFKAIKHADRALARLGEAGRVQEGHAGEMHGSSSLSIQSGNRLAAGSSKLEVSDSAPLGPGDREASEEVHAAVRKLELRRAELLTGVVEASLRVKEVEAIRQSIEAVETFSRLCGSGCVKTLQARYLAAKMRDHVGETPAAVQELTEIIRRCTIVEMGMSESPSGDLPASPACSDFEIASEEGRTATPCSLDTESVPSQEGFEGSPESLPSEAPFDAARLSTSLQLRVELLMSATLTAVEWITKLRSEAQLNAVKFACSIFNALAIQSVENLRNQRSRRRAIRDQRRNRRVANRWRTAKTTKMQPGDGAQDALDARQQPEISEATSEDSEGDHSASEDDARRQKAQDDEQNGRGGFAGSLVLLGRSLLSLLRTRDMREGERQTLELLIQFSNLKFGADSGMRFRGARKNTRLRC